MPPAPSNPSLVFIPWEREFRTRAGHQTNPPCSLILPKELPRSREGFPGKQKLRGGRDRADHGKARGRHRDLREFFPETEAKDSWENPAPHPAAQGHGFLVERAVPGSSGRSFAGFKPGDALENEEYPSCLLQILLCHPTELSGAAATWRVQGWHQTAPGKIPFSLLFPGIGTALSRSPLPTWQFPHPSQLNCP